MAVEKGQFLAACGKEFDRPSKVHGHERICKKCQSLAASAQHNGAPESPPINLCTKCRGPLTQIESDGICSVCKNELSLEAQMNKNQTIEGESGTIIASHSPQSQTPVSNITPEVAVLNEQLREVSEAIKKLAENQQYIGQQLSTLKPVFDAIEEQKTTASGENVKVAAANPGGNGEAPIATGLMSLLPGIAQIINSFKGLGGTPQLGQPGAKFDFAPLVNMVESLTKLEESFWNKRNAPYRAGREDTFRDIRALAGLSGQEDLTRITNILEGEVEQTPKTKLVPH